MVVLDSWNKGVQVEFGAVAFDCRDGLDLGMGADFQPVEAGVVSGKFRPDDVGKFRGREGIDGNGPHFAEDLTGGPVHCRTGA